MTTPSRFIISVSAAALMAPQGVIYNERYLSIGDETLIGPTCASRRASTEIRRCWPRPRCLLDVAASLGEDRTSSATGRSSSATRFKPAPTCTSPIRITPTKRSISPSVGRRPSEGAVTIGSGSWLGANVVILARHQRSGKNTTVAAGAVVRGTFPDHVVLGGVPAKVLRHYEDGEGWVAGAL